jgi:hypothetical protein
MKAETAQRAADDATPAAEGSTKGQTLSATDISKKAYSPLSDFNRKTVAPACWYGAHRRDAYERLIGKQYIPWKPNQA